MKYLIFLILLSTTCFANNNFNNCKNSCLYGFRQSLTKATIDNACNLEVHNLLELFVHKCYESCQDYYNIKRGYK